MMRNRQPHVFDAASWLGVAAKAQGLAIDDADRGAVIAFLDLANAMVQALPDGESSA